MAVLNHGLRGCALMNAVLAIVVALASVPVFYGFVVSDTRCAITADICHPVQSASSSSAPLIAPPSAASRAASDPLQLREAPAAVASSIAGRLADAPDPPPPKLAS